MAEPARWSGWGWAAMAVGLALAAAIAWPVRHESLDWQPALAAAQPWRAWTAAFVHYSPLHLAANVAGALVVAALGQAVPMPRRGVIAWFVAWPLTQLGLLLQPELGHYGGLSGVLHAGVAVVAVHLLFDGSLRQRRIALAMLALLALKLVVEAPWRGALRHPAGWDIAVAPLAHASGALAGALVMTVVQLCSPRRPERTT